MIILVYPALTGSNLSVSKAKWQVQATYRVALHGKYQLPINARLVQLTISEGKAPH